MSTQPGVRQQFSAFLPMLLMGLAVLIWFGFQTFQLLNERENLATLSSNQEAVYQNARKMSGQLDALAAGTQRLAKEGNANAVLIVNELARRGVTINPESSQVTPDK